MLNLLFSRFKWWRQWKGGIWWLIYLPAVTEVGASWLNRAPEENERVYDYENYTTANSRVLGEREFYARVINVARNGQWKDDLNLSKYIHASKQLRLTGLDDVTIFTILDNLYWAAAREATSEMQKRDFSYEDVVQLIQVKKSN